MSSHREAPEISKDPVADSTDVYAFVSPDKPDTVTLIANYIPLQAPAGGPNFYEFGDDVLYEIHIDNNGDGQADISYQFRFQTTVRDPDTFLYNTGPIESLSSPNWNRVQTYSVSVNGGSLGSGLACPPCNIGPLSTPDYAGLAATAVHSLGGGISVFAGQRAEAFYVDLGAIFDLGDLRPFENLHATFGLPGLSAAAGVNATNHVNVHSIALQVPISAVTRSGHPTIGVWTTASRQRVTIWDADNGETVNSGPWRQVSRLGNPLINEVVIPLGRKDQWNSLPPADDKQFAGFVTQPGLATLLPVLYPGVFPNLEALVKSGKPRADLEAILMTGIPAGIIKGFTNFTGSVIADMLRLNTSIKPASKPDIYGLLGGDPAGFPNGRRIADDVVAIELRAIAGVTYPLIDSKFTPDKAAGLLTDGLTPANVSASPLGQFPYLGVPYSGYNTPSLSGLELSRLELSRLDSPGRASARAWPGGSFPGGLFMTESAAGPSGPGTVVLELGVDVGALVLFTPAELDGREIEISRSDAAPYAASGAALGASPDAAPDAAPGARRTHSQVRPRHMAAVTRYAAVYPDLAAGSYTIWADSSRPAGRVVITGGRVTNWSWPA